MINSNVYLQLEFLTELILSSENKKVENIFIVKKESADLIIATQFLK